MRGGRWCAPGVPRRVAASTGARGRGGLCARVPAASDRSSWHAPLTPAGLGRVEAVQRDAIDKQTAVFAGFSRDELAQLRHLCLLLVQQLGRNQGGSSCQS